MQVDNQTLTELISSVVKETIAQLGLGKAPIKPERTEKTAYQKTEQLLYSYNAFKKIVDERMREIEDIKKYGVPQSCAVKEYVDKGGTVNGLVLPEESVDAAVRTVLDSVEGTVHAISLIDKGMAALRNDPYYPILEMRYFEGRTQEDIAVELRCTQKTISQNKSRLIRELSMRLFPDQSIQEMMQ